jgi:hypothetical protein
LVVALLFGSATLVLIWIWYHQLVELGRQDKENAVHARTWHERIWDETNDEYER